jgi:hypothetical protein
MTENERSRRTGSRRRLNKKKNTEPFRKTYHKKSLRLNLTADGAIKLLESLKKDSRYSKAWLVANIEAIQTGNYKPLAKLYYELKFIGKGGIFIIAAPFTVQREAQEDTKFSVLMGKVIFVPETEKALKIVERLQGKMLREEVNKLLAIKTTLATGNLDGENGGEAFIVPDGWAFAKDDKQYVLPALNNATEQYRRAKEGFKKIARIFDSETARILTAPLRKWKTFVKIQNTEYLLHDFGHHSGLGLNFKFAHNLLPTYWLQGMEECRADAIDFAILAELFSDEEAKEIIASNFITRFGVDAHRSGGVNADYDVVAVLWLLDHLLKNGAVQIKNKKLSIRNISTDGLIQSVKTLITEGLEITRTELELERISGLARLYNFKPEKTTLEIFEEFVLKPCRGLASGLR